MCNACGFHCCAWDGFGKCGCDCDEPGCWDDDQFGDYSDDDATVPSIEEMEESASPEEPDRNG